MSDSESTSKPQPPRRLSRSVTPPLALSPGFLHSKRGQGEICSNLEFRYYADSNFESGNYETAESLSEKFTVADPERAARKGRRIGDSPDSSSDDDSESDPAPYDEYSLSYLINSETEFVDNFRHSDGSKLSPAERARQLNKLFLCSFHEHEYLGTICQKYLVEGAEKYYFSEDPNEKRKNVPGLSDCWFWSCTSCDATFCPGCWEHNKIHGGHPKYDSKSRFTSVEDLRRALKRFTTREVQDAIAMDLLLQKTEDDWKEIKGKEKKDKEELSKREKEPKEGLDEKLESDELSLSSAKKRTREKSLSPPGSAATSLASTAPVKKKTKVAPLDDDAEKDATGNERSSFKGDSESDQARGDA